MMYNALISKHKPDILKIYGWLKEHMYNPPKYSEYVYLKDNIPKKETGVYWVTIKGKSFQASKVYINENGVVYQLAENTLVYLKNLKNIPDYMDISKLNIEIVV